MKVLKWLLYPLAALFNLGTRLRNYLYDSGQRPSFEFTTPILAVGNLNVGGSGKTPMVEYMVRVLSKEFAVTTLSRGYGRTTRGYRTASALETPASIGDEPMQLYRKFADRINVVVDEDRVHAIPHILADFPNTNLIILDDALQHRSVKPCFSVLVTDFSAPFYNDFVLPFGRLREARQGSSRADVIVVTKCPHDVSAAVRHEMRREICRYAGEKPVFFSTIRYDHPVAFGNSSTPSKEVILVTGIARTNHLSGWCTSQFTVVKHISYPDHHRYTPADIHQITAAFRQHPGAILLTTEKDMVKLAEPAFAEQIRLMPWFYLPIRHDFVEDGSKFDELVLRAAKSS